MQQHDNQQSLFPDFTDQSNQPNKLEANISVNQTSIKLDEVQSLSPNQGQISQDFGAHIPGARKELYQRNKYHHIQGIQTQDPQQPPIQNTDQSPSREELAYAKAYERAKHFIDKQQAKADTDLIQAADAEKQNANLKQADYEIANFSDRREDLQDINDLPDYHYSSVAVLFNRKWPFSAIENIENIHDAAFAFALRSFVRENFLTHQHNDYEAKAVLGRDQNAPVLTATKMIYELDNFKKALAQDGNKKHQAVTKTISNFKNKYFSYPDIDYDYGWAQADYKDFSDTSEWLSKVPRELWANFTEVGRFSCNFKDANDVEKTLFFNIKSSDHDHDPYNKNNYPATKALMLIDANNVLMAEKIITCTQEFHHSWKPRYQDHQDKLTTAYSYLVGKSALDTILNNPHYDQGERLKIIQKALDIEQGLRRYQDVNQYLLEEFRQIQNYNLPYAIAHSYAENIAEKMTYTAKLLTHFEPQDWDKFSVEQITDHKIIVNIMGESLSLYSNRNQNNKHDNGIEKCFVNDIKDKLASIARQQDFIKLKEPLARLIAEENLKPEESERYLRRIIFEDKVSKIGLFLNKCLPQGIYPLHPDYLTVKERIFTKFEQLYADFKHQKNLSAKQQDQEVQQSQDHQSAQDFSQAPQASSAKFPLTAEQQAQRQAQKEARLLSKYDFYAAKDLLTTQTNIYAVGDKTHTPLMSFNVKNSFELAEGYIQNSKLELIKMHLAIQAGHQVTDQDLRKNLSTSRSGKDWRLGQNIDENTFTTTFNFKGVQFGTNQDKKQQLINNTYDALMDLSYVLEVPPQALSLNGELSLSFGARGKGGVGAPSAHYELTHKIINLTKAKGAGSLAHEWFHAFDHHAGKLLGEDRLASDIANLEKLAPHNKIAHNLVNIMNAIENTNVGERSFNIDHGKSGATAKFSSQPELAARAFESFVKASLADKGKHNDFLVNFSDEQNFEKPPMFYPYLTADELPQVKSAFNELVNNLEAYSLNGEIVLVGIDQQEQQVKGAFELIDEVFAKHNLSKTTTDSLHDLEQKPTNNEQNSSNSKQNQDLQQNSLTATQDKISNVTDEVKNEVDDLETETHEEIHAEQEKPNPIKTKEDVRRLWMEREQQAGLTPKNKGQEQHNELER